MSQNLRCRKCRRILINLSETSVFNPHNSILKTLSNSVQYDCGNKLIEVWYFHENSIPEWTTKNLDEACWQKGKLNCPHCNARIGSFDFISGSKCSCNIELLPPIRLVKSKVDLC